MKNVKITPIKNIIKNNLLMDIPKFTMNDLLLILLPTYIERQNKGIEIKPLGMLFNIRYKIEFSFAFINEKNAPRRENINGNIVIIFFLVSIFFFIFIFKTTLKN